MVNYVVILLLRRMEKNHRLINVFPTSAYRAEALRILQTQQEFNPQITDEFINSYLQILTGKRKYYHGPGNEKSRTDYGRYTTKKDSEDEYITLDNIFWNPNWEMYILSGRV